MYRSELHDILKESLEKTKWTRSTKDEDNYRQVLCSALYNYISPNNVEIPSTRSAHGDIKIFGRRIELKYANNDKVEKLESFLNDFDLLLDDKIEFSIMAIRTDVVHTDNFLHNCVRTPMLKPSGANNQFCMHQSNLSGKAKVSKKYEYKGPSVFLPAVYPHEIRNLTIREGQGRKSTAYLSFENINAIDRSSIIQIDENYIHCDVIGSREDGFIAFLYKKMCGTQVRNKKISDRVSIEYKPNNLELALKYYVDIEVKSKKDTSGKNTVLECGVPLYKI
ncbi:hypothetical protein [Vibrio sp. L85]|uniref:hypothetical protein n=1 Tax=Vibrio sp. L85 TaxID=1769292 RepID=UPI000DEE5F00|nr:hypothetical protein [Vibrio sp. L85]